MCIDRFYRKILSIESVSERNRNRAKLIERNLVSNRFPIIMQRLTEFRMSMKRVSYFAFAGVVSGVASAIFSSLPPLILIVPGLLFGIAIAFSVGLSVRRLSGRAWIALVMGTVLAWFMAMIVPPWIGVLSQGNGLWGAFCHGGLAGGVGATCVAVFIDQVVNRDESTDLFVTTCVVGAVLGSILLPIMIYIHDTLNQLHLVGLLILFPIWQSGVAAAIGYFCVDPVSDGVPQVSDVAAADRWIAENLH